ncbi:MAG TPA: pyridoxal phosphate-dependent aminotransferase [Planctomycetota bacterium]|nr:pyridoxal phosphate-dependent aminotransferase [Planctomycetota bacterium]
MRESRRLREVQAPIIPIVGDLVRATPGTVSLGQGMVGWGPPPAALAEAARAVEDPESHRYQAVEGIAPLVEALGEKLRAENGVPAGRGARVVVTAGGNMGFLQAVLAVTDPGDEVILPAPYYFNHEMAVGMAGARAKLVETDENDQLRPDDVERAIGPRTRAVVTVSPNNPTGAVYPEATLRAVNEMCRARGIYHIHDEAYEYFTYDGVRPFSPGSIPGAEGHTISLYSFSKAYGMAGWRVGYMAIPEHLLEAIRKIQDTNLICPTVAAQRAAWGALSAGPGWCRERVEEVGRTRRVVREALEGLKGLVEAPPAAGAFYFLVRVRTSLEPLALVERLIREHRVAAIPGTAFGRTRGCSIRVAYGALDRRTAAEGIGRLAQGIRAICGGA